VQGLESRPTEQAPFIIPLCPKACGPTVHHTCRENIYLTGLCFLLSSSFKQSQNFPTAQQGKQATSSFGESTPVHLGFGGSDSFPKGRKEERIWKIYCQTVQLERSCRP
jgi:hypothetical protein